MQHREMKEQLQASGGSLIPRYREKTRERRDSRLGVERA
jgi:hypothetical protein